MNDMDSILACSILLQDVRGRINNEDKNGIQSPQQALLFKVDSISELGRSLLRQG